MSIAWQLTDVTGSGGFNPGFMDVDFLDGRVVEITAPPLVLDQRLRKCAAEKLGSNRFALTWGFDFQRYIGSKIFSRQVLQELGDGVGRMIDRLRAMQADAVRRIRLDPAEVIADVGFLGVSTSADDQMTVQVTANIITQASSQDVVLVGAA